MKKIILAIVAIGVVGAGTYFVFFKNNSMMDYLETAMGVPDDQSGGIASLSVPITTDQASADQGNAPSLAPNSTQEFWTKRCNEQGDKYCEIFQRLVTKEKNQRLVEFAVGYPDKGSIAQAVIILPLGVSTSKGATLMIEGKKPTPPIPLKTCLPDGCIVIMQLEPQFVEQMSNVNTLTVGFYDSQEKPINVPLNMMGFAAQLQTIQ